MIWQPIETLPSEFLSNWEKFLVFNDRGQFVVQFDKDFGETGGMDGWFMVSDGKHDNPLRGEKPTHWMPLPEPPEVQSNG